MTVEEFVKEYLNESPCIRVHTSGSTGRPKELLLPKSLVKASALRTIGFFGIGRHSMLYSLVSPDFIGGKMLVVRALEAGCEYGWEEPSNRPSFAGVDRAIDLVSAVPSQVWHILEHRKELPQIRNLLIGGQALPPALAKAIEESGILAYESYGMTETASHIALRRVAASPLPFRPLPGITVFADSRGCLCIRVPELPEPVITNDLVEIDADGGFRVLGRADFVINTGGKKVVPEDVERRLMEATGEECLVTWEADEKWGQRVVALAEHEIPTGRWEEALGLLKPWERPKWLYVTEIPRLENGKPDRRCKFFHKKD